MFGTFISKMSFYSIVTVQIHFAGGPSFSKTSSSLATPHNRQMFSMSPITGASGQLCPYFTNVPDIEMVQTPTVPPPYPCFLPISSLPGHWRPLYTPGLPHWSPPNFSLFCAAGVCFCWSLRWERIRTLSCCLFFFLLSALDRSRG